MTDNLSNKSATRTGVTVLTWGSQDSRLKHQYLFELANHCNNAFLQSYNVGHAAIRVTLQDTPMHRLEVNNLLQDTGIPYKFIKYQTPKLNAPKEYAYSEEVIEVYFSFWPAEDKNDNFTFSSSYQDDLESERLGVSVELNKEKLTSLNLLSCIESRNHRVRNSRDFFLQTKKEINLGFNRVYYAVKDQPILNNIAQAFQQKELADKEYNQITELLEKIKEKQNQSTLTMGIKNQICKILKEEKPNLNDEFFKEDFKEIIKLLENEEEKKMNALTWGKLNFLEKLYQRLKDSDLKEKTDDVIILQKIRILIEEKNESFKETIKKINKNIELYNNFQQQSERLEGIYGKEDFNEKIEGVEKKISQVCLKGIDILKEVMKIVEEEKKENQRRIKEIEQLCAKLKEIELFLNSQEDVEQKIEKIERKISYDDPASVLNKDLDLKIKMILLYPKKIGEVISIALKLKDSFLEKEQNLEKYIKELSSIKKSMIIRLGGKELLEQVILALKEGKNFKKIEKKLFLFFSWCFEKTYKDLDYIDSEMINTLTKGAYFVGKNPDHSVDLPIHNGLDAMAMLKEMAKISNSDKKFDLIEYNCSTTSMQVLKAGAGDKAWIFERGDLGCFFSPHLVHMRAREYAEALSNNNCYRPSKSFSFYNGALNYFGNRFLLKCKEFYDKSEKPKTFSEKAVSGLDLLCSGGTAIAIELTGALCFSFQDKMIGKNKRKIEHLEPEPKRIKRE